MQAFILARKRNQGGLPVIKPYMDKDTFPEFISENELDDDSTGHAMYLLSMVAEELFTLKEIPANHVFNPPAASATDSQNKAAIVLNSELEASIPAARSWIIDLVASHQMRSLTKMNVTNYFKQDSVLKVDGAQILPLIDYVSAKLPKILQNAELRNITSNTKFMSYHTNYSSTARLIIRMTDSLGTMRDKLVTDDTLELVNDSIESPWSLAANMAIPMTIVAMTHVFLSANNMLPEGWVQGERAINEAAVTSLNIWKNIFRAHKRIISDTTAYDAAATEDELLESIPQSAIV